MEKNKKLLLISSIAMIFYVVPSLIFTLINGMGNNLFIKIYNISMFSLSIIGIILFMIYAFSKKNINRGLEFIISIIFFLMNIISGVLGFIYFKRTSTYKMRELPKLEILYNHKKIVYIIVFLISMVFIFVIPSILEGKIIGIILDIIVLAMMILIFYKDLKRDFKYFKEYFREYNSYVFKMFGISLAVILVLSVFIRIYTGIDNATNQTNLMKTMDKMPIYLVLLACVYAPFVEELLFRGLFRKIFNNKWVFIIVCGVVFGALHVIDDFQSIKELLYILLYSSLGMFLSAVYYKTNNLFCNIYFHILQNSLALIGMILLKLLGM